MKILFFLASEIVFIITVIGIILTAIFALFRFDDMSREKKMYIILSLVITMCALVANHSYMKDFVEVPNVVGYTSANASKVLSDVYLQVYPLTDSTSSSGDTVTRQSIQPRDIVMKGTTICLTLSSDESSDDEPQPSITLFNPSTTSKDNTLQISNILVEATAKEKQGDLTGAITLLRNADASVRQNADIVEMLNRLEANFKKQIIKEASSLYEYDGYLAAAQKIQEGIAVLQNDTELTALKEEYVARAPVDLLQIIDYINQKGTNFNDNDKDNLGKDYIRTLRGSDYGNDHFCDYKLSGNYSKLTGSVFIRYKSRTNENINCIFKVIGDGLALYESPALSAGSEPLEYSVNIFGVDKLSFVFEGRGTFAVSTGNVYIYK